MSLVSIYVNKNDIFKMYKQQEQIIKNTNLGDYITLVVRDCLLKQYEMMRNNLNRNMIKKRHFDDKLSGYELIDALYSHIMMHNFTALNDEYFEIYDAISKFKYNFSSFQEKAAEMTKNTLDFVPFKSEDTEAIKELDDKIFMSELLINEEIIDAFHFILEYIILTEELFYLINCTDEKYINTDNLEYLFVDCSPTNVFYTNIKQLIEAEAGHIISYILDPESEGTEYLDSNYKNFILDITRVNRNFVRETNFKDWKEYNVKKYYNPHKFAKMFNLTRIMFRDLMTMISSREFADKFDAIYVMFNEIDENFRLPNNENIEDEIKELFRVLYSVYEAKRQVNIARQNGDPRYVIDGTAEIIGIKT